MTPRLTLFPYQDILLRAVQLCVFKYSEWQERAEEQLEEQGDHAQPGPSSLRTPEVLVSARTVLTSVVERMAKAEPEDFELDKFSDLSASSNVGQKNRLLARLVMNIYEASVTVT